MTHGATMGGHVVKRGDPARRASRPARSRTSSWAARRPKAPPVQQHRAPDRAAPPACPITVERHDREPVLLERAFRRSRWPRSGSSPGEGDVFVAGGVESDLLRAERSQQAHARRIRRWLAEQQARDLLERCCRPPNMVAKRYKPSRRERDGPATARESQQRACAAAAGRQVQVDEIAPIDRDRWASPTSVDRRVDAPRQVTLSAPTKACREGTTVRSGLPASSRPCRAASSPRATPASSPTARAPASLMRRGPGREAADSSRSAAFRGFAVAGCEPDEMGIGPVYAIPKLLQRAAASKRRPTSTCGS